MRENTTLDGRVPSVPIQYPYQIRSIPRIMLCSRWL